MVAIYSRKMVYKVDCLLFLTLLASLSQISLADKLLCEVCGSGFTTNDACNDAIPGSDNGDPTCDESDSTCFITYHPDGEVLKGCQLINDCITEEMKGWFGVRGTPSFGFTRCYRDLNVAANIDLQDLPDPTCDIARGVKHDGFCYHISENVMSWDDAKSYCESFDRYQLASIDAQKREPSRFVVHSIDRGTGPDAGNTALWIGLHKDATNAPSNAFMNFVFLDPNAPVVSQSYLQTLDGSDKIGVNLGAGDCAGMDSSPTVTEEYLLSLGHDCSSPKHALCWREDTACDKFVDSCPADSECVTVGDKFKCICDDGRDAVFDRDGKLSCDFRCVCGATGDPHYDTCDGFMYDFMGGCFYALSILCEEHIGSGLNNFGVYAKNKKVGNHFVSSTEFVVVDLYINDPNILTHHVVIGPGTDVFVCNPGFINKVFDCNSMTSTATGAYGMTGVTIFIDATTVILSTDFGVSVEWVGINAIVKVSEDYKGKLCGLCGNYNDDPSDDTTIGSHGQPTPCTEITRVFDNSIKFDCKEFGDSWEIEGQFSEPGCQTPVTPPCNETIAAGALARCNLMNPDNVASPFYDCITAINADPTTTQQISLSQVGDCVFDVCNIDGDAACQLLIVMAMRCYDRGFNVSGWHAAANCPAVCVDPDKEFLEGVSACVNICGDEEAVLFCILGITEGCRCKDGKLEAGGVCVDSCGCVTENGEQFPVGSTILNEDCDSQLECFDGGVSIATPFTCSEPKCCQIKDNVRGCFCPDGYADDGNGGCQDIDECLEDTCCGDGMTCENTIGGYNCKCDDGSYPFMIDGSFACQERGICTVYGDPHFKMFDGATFDMHGACTYTLAKTCANDNANNFNIEVRNSRHHIGNADSSTAKYVTVDLYDDNAGDYYRVLLRDGKAYYCPPPITTLDQCILLRLPIHNHQGMLGVWIRIYGQHVILNTNWGLHVMFCYYSLEVRVPMAYKNKMCGLCGNYNDDPTDDVNFATQCAPIPGSVPPQSFCNQYGTAHKVSGVYSPNGCDPVDSVDACGAAAGAHSTACQNILTGGKFADCAALMSATEFNVRKGNCIYDRCRGADDCEILEAYADMCYGLGVDLEDWRVLNSCTLTCSGTNIAYKQLMSGCTPSCSDPHSAFCCDLPATDGCGCLNDGNLFSNAQGEDQENICHGCRDCGCLRMDTSEIYDEGTSYINENCTLKYVCQADKTWKVNSLECHPDATCSVDDGQRGCVCKKGYTGNGITLCVENVCTSLVFDNGVVTSPAVTTNVPTGTPMTFDCNNGYIPDGADPGPILCNEDGEWCNPAKCKINTCLNPPDPNDYPSATVGNVFNPVGQGNGPFAFNSTAAVTCIECHLFSDGDDSKDLNCTSPNGDWDGPHDICTMVTCDNPPSVNNSAAIQFNPASSTNPHACGTTATYSCDPGFDIDVPTMTLVCTAVAGSNKGVWRQQDGSNTLPSCTENSCASNPTNGGDPNVDTVGPVMNPFSNNPPYDTNSTSLLTCRSCFFYSNDERSKNIVCVNNSWSDIEDCQEKFCSAHSPNPDNTIAPVYTIGNVEQAGPTYSCGTKVTYECKPGFKKVNEQGVLVATCNAASADPFFPEWSPVLTSCIANSCTGLPDINNYPNGVSFDVVPSPISGTTDKYAYGSTVEMSCNDCSESDIGTSSVDIVCLNDNTWSTETCLEITCDANDILDEANIQFQRDDSSRVFDPFPFADPANYPCNSTVTYTCDDCYHPVDDPSKTMVLTCKRDLADGIHSGGWMGDLNSCIGNECTDLMRDQNPSSDQPIIFLSNATTGISGEDFQFDCPPGTKASDLSIILECAANGTWKNPPTCMNTSCTNPGLTGDQSIDRTMPVPDRFLHLSELYIKCSGSCDLFTDGSFRKKIVCNETIWTPDPTDLPKCEIVKCPILEVPVNGERLGPEVNITCGNLMDIGCNVGYQLNVDSGDCERGLGGGAWLFIPDVPELLCNENSCFELPTNNDPNAVKNDVDNGFILDEDDMKAKSMLFSMGTRYRYGVSFKTMCNSCYVYSTDPDVTESESVCLTSNTWSDPGLCIEIFCEDPPLGSIASNHDPSAPSGAGRSCNDTVTYSCLDGFESDGNMDLTCRPTGPGAVDWEGTLVSCTRNSCANGPMNNDINAVFDPAGIENPSGQTAPYSINSTQDVQCNHCYAYVISGVSTIDDTLVCESGSNAWSAQKTCQLVYCEAASPIADMDENEGITYDTMPVDNLYSCGTNATYKCEEGFQIGTTIKRMCVRDLSLAPVAGVPRGRWENVGPTDPDPVCTRNSCEMPPQASNNATVGQPSNPAPYPFNTTATVTCFPCHQLPNGDTSVIVTCESTTFWTTADDCIPVTCAATSTTAANVVTDPNNYSESGPRYQCGTIATYGCEPGFAETGNMQQECVDDANGNGPNEEADGAWENQIAMCTEDSCTEPMVDPNKNLDPAIEVDPAGEVPNSSPIRYVPLTTADINCIDECHELDSGSGLNTQTIQCIGTSWTNQQACHSVTCSATMQAGFEFLENNPTYDQDSTDGMFPCGTVASFACRKGYNFNGPNTRQCMRDPVNGGAIWSGDLNDCVPNACTDINGDLAPRMASSATSTGVTGQTIVYACDAGYIPQSADLVLLCAANGTVCILPNCTESNCVTPSVGDNSFIKSTSDSDLGHGTEAVIECNACHEYEGGARSMNITCETVSWSPSGDSDNPTPACTLIECPASWDTTATVGSPGTGPFTCGQNVEHVCQEGFISENLIQWCRDTGTWDPPSVVCTENSCSDEPVDNYPHASQGNPFNDTESPFVHGTQIPVTCDPCYMFPGGERTRFIDCLLNNTWSTLSEECELVNCPSPPAPDNTRNVTGPFPCDRVVNYVCIDGFEPVNSSAMSLQCKEILGSTRTEWVGMALGCKRKGCDTPTSMDDNAGVTVPDLPIYPFSFVGTLHCHECYLYPNLACERPLTCISPGIWSPEHPKCVRQYCSAFTAGALTNMNVTYSTAITQYGFECKTVATFYCAPGYKASLGSFTRKCKVCCHRGAIWTGTPAICIRRVCRHLDAPTNGGISSTTPQYAGSGSVTFHCKPGFYLVGNAVLTCDINGNWDHEPPRCFRIRCQDVSDLLHGFITYYGKFVGYKLSYKCNPGYSLVGNEERNCIDDGDNDEFGVWDGEDPTCENINECDDEPRVCAVEATCHDLVPHENAEMAKFFCQCEDGYTGAGTVQDGCSDIPECNPNPCCHGRCIDDGPNSRRCVCDPCWAPGENGLCCTRIMCGQPDSVDNAEVSVTGCTCGSTATYECDYGYYQISGSLVHTCTNGAWVGQLPVCAVIQCTDPDDGTQSSWTVNDYNWKGNTFYACNTDYEYESGNFKRTCIVAADGVSGVWSGSALNCKEIRCHTPVPILNGDFNPKYPYYGAVNFNQVEYTCSPGYHIPTPGDEVLICDGPGWNKPPPVCERIDCGMPGPDPFENGDIDTSDGTKFGDTAVYTCDCGFELNGEDKRTCLANGEWSGSAPFCQDIDECARNTDDCDDNADCTNYVPSASNNYLKYDCTCHSGYTGNGHTLGDGTGCSDIGDCVNQDCCGHGKCIDTGANSFVCHCDYTYYGTLCCQRVKCNRPNDGVNADLTPADNTFNVGDLATYRCHVGHIMGNNDTMKTVKCQIDSSWSGSRAVCHRVSCGDPGPGTNAIASGTDWFYQDMVTYVCENGYKFKFGDYKITCGADGEWIGTPLQCTVDTCPDPGPGVGAIRMGDDFSIGQVVHYKCKEGYESIDEPLCIVCLPGGTWSGTALYCKEMICREPMNGINADKVVVNGDYSFGGLTNYTCHVGFELIFGRLQRYCVEQNGQAAWEGYPPVCMRSRCELTDDIQNGQFKPAMPFYEYGDMVTYYCDKGYVLYGQRKRTCQVNGYFDGETPECRRRECAAPRNGTHSYYGGYGKFYYGDCVTYKCKDGYKACRSEVRQVCCLYNGYWSHPPLDCVNINECRYYDLNDCHKDATCIDLDPWRDGKPYECKCNVGHEGNGHTSNTEYWDAEGCDDIGECDTNPCGPHGDCKETSSGRRYVCTCHRGYYGPDCNEVVTCEKPCTCKNAGFTPYAATYYYDTDITYKCIHGYEPVSGDDVRTCQHNGRWSGSALCCDKVNCGRPDRGSYSYPVGRDWYFGGVVDYKCKCGYVYNGPIGDLTRVCQANGNWSGYAPDCERRQCGPPPGIENGGYHGSNFYAGSTVEYYCNHGYFTTDDLIIKCKSNGYWSGPAPTCQQISCEKIQAPPFSDQEGDGHNYKDVIKFSCWDGYRLKGAHKLTCQKCGRWDYDVPKCVDINECKDDAWNDCHDFARCYNLVPHRDREYRKYKCVCRPGTLGDGHTIYPGTGCTDIGECDSKPCGDHGVCSEPCFNSFLCECNEGYWGPLCKKRIRCYQPLEGIFAEIINPKDVYYFGDHIKYKCDDGYGLHTGDLHRRCQYNSEWTGVAPYCKRLRCKYPGKGVNAIKIGKNYDLGDMVKYICKCGHQLASGSTKITCVFDGYDDNGKPKVKWDGIPAVCESKSCKEPEPGANSYIEGKDYSNGAVVVYRCNDCYESCECSREPHRRYCRNGHWTSVPLHCTVINCGDPGEGINAYKTGSADFRCGSTVTYVCEEDCYYRSSKSEYTITCGKNGKWDGKPPNCKRRPRPPRPPPPPPPPKGYNPPEKHHYKRKYPGRTTPPCQNDTDCCSNAQCVSGHCQCNQGFVGDGKDSCKEVCVCRVRGDPYMDGYDGTFCILPTERKDVKYLLTKYNMTQDDPCSLMVELMTSHPMHDGATLWGADMPRYIDIHFGGEVMRFDQAMVMSIAGIPKDLPYYGNGFSVDIMGNFVVLDAQDSCGIQVGFEGLDLSSVVTIRLPASLGEHLEGMCGNCDGRQDIVECGTGIDITNNDYKCNKLADSCVADNSGEEFPTPQPEPDAPAPPQPQPQPVGQA